MGGGAVRVEKVTQVHAYDVASVDELTWEDLIDFWGSGPRPKQRTECLALRLPEIGNWRTRFVFACRGPEKCGAKPTS